jgi:hypothetical protein
MRSRENDAEIPGTSLLPGSPVSVGALLLKEVFDTDFLFFASGKDARSSDTIPKDVFEFCFFD